MRKSLVLVTILALLLGIAAAALAAAGDKPAGPGAPGPGGPGRPGQNMQWMEKVFAGLNLSQDQKTKLEQIRKEFADAMKNARESDLSGEEIRDKVMSLSREMWQKINALLTKEQQEKLTAAMKEMREQMRPGAGGPADVAKRFKDKLGLSDKQVKQIEQIGKESNDKIAALCQGAGDNREGLRDKINAVRQEAAVKVMAVLTAEQKEKLAAIKKEIQEQAKQNGGGSRPGPGGNRPDDDRPSNRQ